MNAELAVDHGVYIVEVGYRSTPRVLANAARATGVVSPNVMLDPVAETIRVVLNVSTWLKLGRGWILILDQAA